MFEALFDRRLKPVGAFADELKDAGYDRARSVPTYSTEVWTKCLEVARRARWPNATETEAYRHLGREFAEGFLETLIGRMVLAALPYMSPQTFVKRLANYLRLGRRDEGLTFDLTRDEPIASDATVHNPAGVPGTFVAGIIDAAMARMKVKWTTVVEQRSPCDYTLTLRWHAG